MAQKQFKIGLSNADKQNMAQDVYERLLALTFPEYETTESYEVGDFVVYNDQLYKCIGATSGAWDSTKWQLATLNDLLADIEGAVAFVNDKANVDGNYPTMTVGAADNMTPYDEDSGVNQEQPFLLQGTGCGNGEQIVDTGELALLKEKQGNSVVVNQWAKEITASNYNISGIFEGHYSISNNAITFTEVPANSSYARLFCKEPFVSGHKVLVHFYATVSEGSIRVGLFADGGYSGANSVVVSSTDTNPNKYLIVQINQEDEVSIMTAVGSQTSGLVKDLIAVDLTQWFGSNDNIPADLLAHPEDFFRYYQGSLAYNEGTLVNANGRYIKCIGRQQWDEEWELGGINSDTGENVADNTRIRSKNYIKVIPNKTYYGYIGGQGYFYPRYYDANKNFIGVGTPAQEVRNSTFTVPSNACYMRWQTYDYGTTYNHDITISIYYEGESGYDQYYPYELLTNNDTGSETLRSAGSVKDTKAPDGTITRRVGVVDLGTLTWEWQGDGCAYTDDLSSLMSADNVSLIEGGFIHLSQDDTSGYWNLIIAKCYYSNTDGRIYLRDSSATSSTLTSLLSGKKLFYKLATPTTEQGTTFSENVAIDDFGSMDFGGTNGVPQGASIFYAVDYKAFIDSLYNNCDGDATDIVKESELDTKLAALGYVKLTSVSGYDVTKTQVLKNISGTLTWVTEGE